VSKPPIQAGFDYIQAILELRNVKSYSEIAYFCGYDSKRSISQIINGTEPSHAHGEALYILYVETFGRKPK
jgi:hypothetical protein